MTKLQVLNREVVACRLCPRLVEYRERVAKTKRRAFMDWEYWGKPVPGFGDPKAKLLIIGLAPAAHGGNRTGRVFTGDRSGDFLYKALYDAGFASQPTSTSIDDGLTVSNVYIAASVRCAPPDNKPTPEEFRNCRPYLEREIALLPGLRVVVVLGKIAMDTYLTILKSQGKIERRSAFDFGHNRLHRTGPDQPVLICSYHPSQQNTSTGKLTASMLDAVFLRAKEYLN
jgi:uracil-DNA glycosylase family 4